MEKENKQTFAVNDNFKTQLVTAILSSPIVYIPHYNYAYVDRALSEIVNSDLIGDLSVREYSPNGCVNFFSKKIDNAGSTGSWTSDMELMEKGPTIFMFKNMAEDFSSNPGAQSRLQYFAERYERGEFDSRCTVIIVSPQPIEMFSSQIERLTTVVDVPNPTESEIENFVNENFNVSRQFTTEETELKSQLTRALQGLQQYEIEQIVRSVKTKTGGFLTKKTIAYALNEKKSIVRKSGIIEVIDSDVSFDMVGGLENLKSDLKRKAVLFENLGDLSKVRLPLPKGVLILGMPGCGKSLVAKSIANLFKVSLLRLDVSRLMGQYVGQSEANMRRALATAEAAHPCVLWIDEIEKAFAGSNGGGGNDIVMRLMGYFLTWMQERKTAVYIVATANDAMRPEFMRKGRFDEVYFVDFPKLQERKDILKKKIDSYTKSIEQQRMFDISELGNDEAITKLAELMKGSNNESDGFSGSEIQSVVEAVIEKKFVDYANKKRDALSKKQDTNNLKVKVTKKDFEDEINIIKPSIMANQKGLEVNGSKQKTSVERIRDLQKIYKFRSASK